MYSVFRLSTLSRLELQLIVASATAKSSEMRLIGFLMMVYLLIMYLQMYDFLPILPTKRCCFSIICNFVQS